MPIIDGMWKELITDLLEIGMTQTQIAQEMGVTQPTVWDLLNGNTADPRWTGGDRLIRLHRRKMKQAKKAA